jgi:hypothetical protein
MVLPVYNIWKAWEAPHAAVTVKIAGQLPVKSVA